MEIFRSGARARKPGPNFRLAVNKPNFIKPQRRLELEFLVFICEKLGPEASLRDILTGSGSSLLDIKARAWLTLKNLSSYHLLLVDCKRLTIHGEPF